MKIHLIKVPPGYEAAVNGRIEDQRPLRVGKYDQVHFVGSAPFYINVPAEATCRETLTHKVSVLIKLELQRDRLVETLRDAGYATYRDPISLSAQDFATRQNLSDAITAIVQSCIRDSGFLDLTKPEQFRQALQQRINAECAKARLSGEVVSCDVRPILPEPGLLAQLAAAAGLKETVCADGRAREYSDVKLGQIVEYFLETLRQRELIEAETERAKAETERKRVEAQQQIAIARADKRIVELEQENRVAARQSQLQDEESRWQQAAQERNAAIKESGAAYEFAYKGKRLDEELALAQKALQIAKTKDEEETALRERKRLDIELELEREKRAADIRVLEKAGMLTPIGALFEKAAGIPAPNYSGIHTLINGSGVSDAKEAMTGLLLSFLSSVTDVTNLRTAKRHEEGTAFGTNE